MDDKKRRKEIAKRIEKQFQESDKKQKGYVTGI